MMKKGRRVLMEASASFVVGEDEKMRIKIRDLTEEYEVLEKETEAIQVRLHREKHKKLNLLAEVRQAQKGALKRFPSQTPESLPAIPLQRNNHIENEGGRMTPHGVLDLNQISHLRPEETGEFQVVWEPLGGEKNLKQALVDGDSESGDVNLSICRDVGGSSRMGKRKISWQDQVALRV
ncbi:hypothetical protein QJS10_CPB17g00182 [Acorus calamus]|uniref:Uncharacterized protein n=1 Tax=Acorus calamus TaxID=4465 RepID=A0AAV9CXS1_ACOCL|nr:hypothetical protein QJS10_CPB17g00182 [Acorus calamus]